MAARERMTDLLKGALIVLALLASIFIAAGVISFLRDSACERLDAERISHLEPGHTTRGPGSMYVIGIEPGPPPSQITEYWEAVSAMTNAGCDVPGEDWPTEP